MSNKNLIMLLVVILIGLVIITTTDGAQDSTLCDTGIKISQRVEARDLGNALTVFDKKTELIFFVAFDFNRDGMYELLFFDTNGNGYIDMQLGGGRANAQQVMELYCMYQQLEMS